MYDASAIAKQVSNLGNSITEWAVKEYQASHSDILAIPVLRGGLFFFADLVRAIGHSVEVAPAQSWGYQTSSNEIAKEHKIDISNVPAKGRSVLIVDDICDSGRTLEVLQKKLLEAGAREVKTAVLIKRVLSEETFEPDWVGFKYSGHEWFVGYGMEDCDRYRNLPGIYLITKS